MAEDATTESAEDEDLQLALQVVKAMRADRDEVELPASTVAGRDGELIDRGDEA